MWLGSLSLLPPVMMLLCALISAFQLVQAFYNLIQKGVIMRKERLFDESVWNLRWL